MVLLHFLEMLSGKVVLCFWCSCCMDGLGAPFLEEKFDFGGVYSGYTALSFRLLDFGCFRAELSAWCS